jgi:hypothetical protein
MLRVRGNGPTWNNTSVNGNMNYNFLNGVPRRITLFATPIEQQNDVKADLGMFAQDSWAMSRMTINYGFRYDYLHVGVPAQHLAAGQFVPERNFAPVENAPKWKDINPRVGVSYDLFGTGKTVAKVTIGRYISGGSLATNVNPVNASVNNATRSWTDSNFNYAPDCDFSNPATNGECGPLSNLNFGKVNPTATQFDRKCSKAGACGRTTGASVPASSVRFRGARRLMSATSVAGHGNFTVVDNQLVTPRTPIRSASRRPPTIRACRTRDSRSVASTTSSRRRTASHRTSFASRSTMAISPRSITASTRR